MVTSVRTAAFNESSARTRTEYTADWSKCNVLDFCSLGGAVDFGTAHAIVTKVFLENGILPRLVYERMLSGCLMPAFNAV